MGTVTISCKNPSKDPEKKCDAPNGKFDWSPPEGATIIKKGEEREGAESYIVACPYCGYQNKVWLKGLPTPHIVIRKIENEYEVEPADDLDRFWLETARTATKDSISAVEEAAKQLIAIIGTLQLIYFAAISFSDLKGSLSELMKSPSSWWTFPATLLFVSPILAWLFSFGFAMTVFTPKSYSTNLNSPSISSKTYIEIATYKQGQLQLAYKSLLVGFVLLAVSIGTYLWYMPLSPAPPANP